MDKDTIKKVRIVLAIALVLYSIRYYMKYRENLSYANQRTCSGNMRLLENALEMYDMDKVKTDSKQTTYVCPGGKKESFTIYSNELIYDGFIPKTIKCPTTGKVESYSVFREKDVIYIQCEIHNTVKDTRL